MSAIAAVIMQVCNHGDHVVASNTLYGGTFALFKDPAGNLLGVAENGTYAR